MLECVANWNVSVFEPLKFVPAADVKDDLESKGAESDFHKVEEEVRTSQISELLLVFDEKVRNEKYEPGSESLRRLGMRRQGRVPNARFFRAIRGLGRLP